jgi:minor extracellular serine protease Vpr
MFKRFSPLFLLSLFLLLSILLSPHIRDTFATAEPGVSDLQLHTERTAPAHLQEVPAEIQELFADGISIEEFVQMTGHVPSAVEAVIEGEALMIIELEGEPLAVHYANQKATGIMLATESMESYRSNLLKAQADLTVSLEKLDVTVISNYTTAYNGIQALIPFRAFNEIRRLPGVKAIHRAPIHEPALSGSVPLIGATDVWNDFGFDGEGIVIAIIDTGIDYTHAAFGGSGDPDDYINNDPDVIEPGTFPTAKVIGGYDFAGTTYNANPASPSYQPIPNPDPDPLDENRHGTHVASIAAGMATSSVGAGVAPEAKLIALKVFGVSGSTALVLDALDAATHSYLLYGFPHVINMSLGSNFGTNDHSNPSNMGADNAAAAGIVVVASAGNAGNHNYITGAPASADKAISVAASTSGFLTGPTINIAGTTYITQTNIVYTPASFDDDTGHYEVTTAAPLAYVANLAGAPDNQLCSTAGITPADALDGQIALIQRGTCAFSDKVNNAAELGAVGTIIYNNAPGPFGGIGVPVLIPAAFIQMQDGINLIPADGETVVVDAKDDVKTVPDPYTPADSIAAFSSRGPRGYDSALKPEITAPGVATFAADMGGGTTGVSLSGTSMAAPHVAGVAALMLQANPDWTPEQVKAIIMNTAVPLADNTVIPRSGAGRVNAYRSVAANALAIADEDLVTLNWGVIMSGNDNLTRVSNVTLYNWDAAAQLFDTNVAFQMGSRIAGATLSVEPAQVTVPAGGSAIVTVTLNLDLTEIPVLYGTTGLEEYYGFVTFTPPGGDPTDTLLVPFYFQPRPFAQLDIDSDGTIVNAATGSATLELTHSGPITSSLYVYPALAWNELPQPGMRGPGDVRLFGMDYGFTHATQGDIIEVGINAHGPWHVPQPFFAEFDLYIDADQDNSWDYVNFNYNLGWLQNVGHTNQWIVVQFDLENSQFFLGSPFLVFTDYNASYMEWYLPAAWQDLGPTDSTFDYQLLGFDSGGFRSTPPGSFDYVNSPFDWTISNNPGPANDEATIEVSIGDMAGYLYSQPAGVMITDLRGDPQNENGGQAYFQSITIATISVSLEPETAAMSGAPGTTVHYILELTNEGDVTDTFDLTQSGATWTVALSDVSVELAAGASTEVTVSVTIPANAADGASDTVTITATSQSDEEVTATSTLTTTAEWYRIIMPLIMKP